MAVDPDVIPVIDDKVKAAIDAARVEWQKDIADALGQPPPVDPPPVDPPPPLPVRTRTGPVLGNPLNVDLRDKHFVGTGYQPTVQNKVLELGSGKVGNSTVDGLNGGQGLFVAQYAELTDLDFVNCGGGATTTSVTNGHYNYVRRGPSKRCRYRWAGTLPVGDATFTRHGYGTIGVTPAGQPGVELSVEDEIDDTPLRWLGAGGSSGFRVDLFELDGLRKTAGSVEWGLHPAAQHRALRASNLDLPGVDVIVRANWQEIVLSGRCRRLIREAGTTGHLDISGLRQESA